MRGHCVLIVLLFAVSYVAAQFPAVPLVQLEKTLAFGTTLSAQQLPPCYSVNYVVSGGTYYATSASQISANVFFLEFYLSEATSSVSVELCYRSGSTGQLIPIPITSQFVGVVGGNTYDNCNPGTNAISAQDEDNCGVNYYCSTLIRQLANVTNPQLIVRVTTTYAESEPGITFNLTLTQRIIPVTITQLGSSFTTSNIVSPVGVPQFVPSINQVLYYVQLKPASTDRIGVATYLAQSSGLTQVQFRLSNINVNGLADTEDWSLAINERALAVINIANTQTTFDCSAFENITRTVSSLTDDVVIRIPSCDNLYTEYFISVGVPADSQAWTYTLTTSFVGTSNPSDFSTYVPTFVTISANNTIVPSMVGNGYYYDYYDTPYQASFFFLNIQSTSDSLTNMVVTIFGITRSQIEAGITKNTLGLYSYCNNANDFVSSCQNGPLSAGPDADYPLDYCKMTVTNCEFSSSNYYFLSVTSTGGTFGSYQYYSGIDYESYDYGQLTTSFSVLVQVTTINPIAITSLPGTVVNGFTVYTDISAVANQAYNHYIFSLTPAMITPSTHIRVEFYSVNEQTPVTLYMNYNSLAGNVAENFNGVYDQDYDDLYYNQPQNSQCLSSIWSCTTVTDRNNYYDSINTCFRNIPYCDLIANGASSIYFSVYGAYVSGVDDPKNFNNYEGYNRSVSYTLKVSYRNTPELLFDRITNVQHLPRTYVRDRVYPLGNDQPHSYSHQFMFSVPKSSSQSVISQVRFRLHDFFKNCYNDEEIFLYLQCNNPTGECPCYLSQQSCEIDDEQDQYCDVASNLCSCPTGNFYLSVVASHDGGYYCQRPYAYQITPFLVSAPIADTIYTNELGINNVVTYSDVLFQNIPFDLTGYAGQSLGYYFFPQYYSTSQQVYQIINNAESTTDLLNVRVKYGVIAELDPLAFVPIQISRGVVAFDNGCLVSFCTGWKSDFQSEYYQPSGPFGPQAYWCQTTIQSCYFTQDVYYIRLFSWTTNFLLNEENGYSALSKQTIDYTLEISVEDNSALPLSLNVPVHAYVQTETYAHYSIDVTTVPTNSWLRISAYLNQDTSKITQLFLNYDSLAGQNNNFGSCFNSISRCLFGSYRAITSPYTYYGSFDQEFSNSQYCDFFFEPCEIPSTGSIYVSIWGNWVVEVENSLEYTIIAESQSIIQLNSAMGYPTTGLLLYNQVAYYSFTLDSTDFRPFVIQLQSIEPYPSVIVSGVLETTFSTVIPGTTTTTGACDCTGTYKYDAFSTIIYNCGDITSQPQYMTIRNTLESYYTPVSYTVRAYYHNRYNMNLNVQNNVQWNQVAYTQIPQSLNYNEVLDVVVSSTQLQSNALYIGISDVSYTNTSENGYDRSLNAYLSFGRPGSPECFTLSASVVNTLIPNPENILMYAFQIPPCTSCSGTYYLSIYAQFYEPQPLNRLKLNFTVAAWTQAITTPIGFPTNIRSNATNTGGATFTFAQTNTIVTCDTRFGSDYFIDYFFTTPSIQTNTYETFEISYPNTGSVSNTFFDISTVINGCFDCPIVPGQTCIIPGCTNATNNIIYGAFGLNSCPANNNQTVSGGISLNFEIDDSQIFTTTTQTINPSSTTSITVAPRVIAQYVVSFSSVDFSTWPEFDLSASINSGSGGVCYTAGSTGVAFPPPTLCPGICNTQSIALDPCCYDSTDSYTVTVYNSDTTTSLTGTITATLTPLSLGSEISLSLGNTVPSATSFATASTGLYKFIRFQLTSSNWNSDSVLVIQVFNAASTGGSRTVYLNYARYGGQSSDTVCLQNIAQLCSTGSGNCNVQLPAGGCTSSPLVNGYGTYFLSIVSDTASTSTTTTALIYAQTTNSYVTSVTGNVPQISQATNEFYTHFKFAIVRTIGDSSFEALDRRYQIRLTYTDTTQDLELNIHNPWFYPSSNLLAGDNTQPIFGSCPYTDDPDWTCVSDSTSDTCTVPLCLTTGSNPYIYSQGSNKFVYVSARNLNSSPSVTSFTITNSIVSFGTMPTDEPVYFVNSISQPTDTIFTSACSTSSSGTSGGCQYTPSSTVSTVYFTLPISTLTWKSTDMLLLNFTQISSNANSFDVYLWTDSQCEVEAFNILDTSECYAESTECWEYFSQQFSSLFKTDSGAGATTPFTFTIYLRVEGLDSNTAFNFQSRIYSPFSATTTLTPTNLAYTNNLLSWTGRQLSFNVITPATSNYNLLINAQASCYDDAPILIYSTLNYQWPTGGYDSLTLDGAFILDGTQPSPIVLNSCGIVVGGNNYFTILTATNESPIHPIPQVQIYFSASLDYPFEEQTLGWNTADFYTSGPSGKTFSFVHIAQGENFGSQADFALIGCPSCSLKVISPFYRQNLVESNVAANSLEPNIYTPLSPENVEYISTGSECVSAACSSADGVFCTSVPSTYTGVFPLSIPTCQFTNGRYFVYVTVPANYIFGYASLLTERDYALLRPTISNPKVVLYDTLTPGPASLVSTITRYQFYQVVADRQSSFYVKMIIDIDFSSNGNTLIAYAQPGFQSLFSTQTSTIGTSTASCSSLTCTTSDSFRPCYIYDFLCNSPTIDVTTINYFVGIRSTNNPCTPIGFTFTVITREPRNYRLISNNIPVCDQIETYSNVVPYSGLYRTSAFIPNNAYFYQVDTIGLNLQFATLTVKAIQNNLNSNLPIEIYYGNLPARCQTNCALGPLSLATDLSVGNQGSITCGLGPQIWITAFTDSSVEGRTDYQLVASITERPISSVSSNSVTTVTGSQTFSITNTGIITSISTVGATIHSVALSDKPVNVGCSNLAGCPDLRSCQWLSQSATYNVLVDKTTSSSVDQCGNIIGTTNTLSVVSITPTVLSETTIYSLTSGQLNVFTRTFNVSEQTVNGRFRVRIGALTSGQNLLNVYIGCNGAIAPGDSTCNYYVDDFSTSSTLTSSWITLCDTCTTAFITVQAQGCDIDRFQVVVDFEPNYLPSTGVALTNSWQSGAIQKWAITQDAQTNYWSFTSGTDGFIHIGIGNVNNTNPSLNPLLPPNPILELTVYLKGCIVAQCQTGLSSNDYPTRFDFKDKSCFVNFAAPVAGLTYIAAVSNPTAISSDASGAFYRAQAFNSFTDISTGSSSTNYQIQGRARHYYKTTAINSNGLASVVIHLNILDGPRLLVQVADSPNFIFNQNSNSQNYDGWVQSKICPFGECTIEIPTYASHPGVNTLYVWVTPAATNSDDMHDVIEKPTNYRIYSTVGVQNCGPISTAVPRTGFCSNVTVASASNGFWLYRDASIRVQDAFGRYDALVNGRCPIATSQCRTYLNRFACLMVFRECDAQGFIVSQCRGDCQSAVNVCGPWYDATPSCNEQYPQLECSNSRYLDNEPCTGDLTNSPSSGGYDFGLPGSIITPSPAPPGGQTGGGFNGVSPVPSPSNVPITPDQEEPPIGRSPSKDCLLSPTPSPATVFIPGSATPTVTVVPPSGSASRLTVTMSFLLTILSMLWLAL